MKIALLCTLVVLFQVESLAAASDSSCPGLPGKDGGLGQQGSPGTCSCSAQISTEEPLCSRSLGLSSYKPAKSCREILQCNPSAPSGYYWLKSTSTECQQVYCAMDTPYCNITGGWMRLAYFNITEPGVSCPSSLRQINTPAKLCGRTGKGCSRVRFSADGIRYSKVCGQARGYQYYTTNAFRDSGSKDINSHYVDGIGITYGSPRQHLWTYAAGLSDDFDYVSNCPCAKNPGRAPPAFVGLDYYCESGVTGRWQDNRRIALDDPLWDGDGCGPGNSCCNQTGLPWFYRNLLQEVGDDIEMHLCGDSGTNEEEVYVELVEIFVQ